MNIGKRQRVENLREVWPKETDFSDWLVSEDGLALIAEDIGVEVEDSERECRPGDFPCDIVGHVLGDDNHRVVVENQFGRTNHDHLGKLLTYAAQHAAMTGIWLSEAVSDDHRQVIDWLNANTPPNISLYLAQIKAYRVGDTVIAQLDVVSRPNLQTKVERTETGAEKERHLWRRDMWQDILGHIKAQKPPFRVQSASDDNWSVIVLGRSNFFLSLTLTPKRQCIGCDLTITVPWKDDAFAQLFAQRADIEAEIGQPLNWLPMLGKKSARVLLETTLDPKIPANCDTVKQWLYEQALVFHKTFQPRVKQLRATIIGDVEEE